MGYEHDMSKEKERKPPLPEGWRKFEILNCVEQISKSGNEMFVFTFVDLDLQQEEEVYAVATEGKRWFLKQILKACKIEGDEKGVFNWEIDDLIGKTIMGRVEHTPEEWINRDGVTKVTVKGKIAEIKALTV